MTAEERAVEPAHRRALGFPRARRIRKRADFVRIQQAPAARVSTRHLLLLLCPREAEGPSRLGVVASRKVGPAVARNRAKRLVREAFRQSPGAFPPRLDVVIVVRPGTHQLAAGDLLAEVRQAKGQILRRAAEIVRAAPEGA